MHYALPRAGLGGQDAPRGCSSQEMVGNSLHMTAQALALESNSADALGPRYHSSEGSQSHTYTWVLPYPSQLLSGPAPPVNGTRQPQTCPSKKLSNGIPFSPHLSPAQGHQNVQRSTRVTRETHTQGAGYSEGGMYPSTRFSRHLKLRNAPTRPLQPRRRRPHPLISLPRLCTCAPADPTPSPLPHPRPAPQPRPLHPSPAPASAA